MRRQEQAIGVHQDVTLAAGEVFARVVIAWSPFSVVFTLWLSRMAALG